MAGTVNVSRDLWDDPTFKNSEMSQREAWLWIISKASWKDRVVRVGTVEVETRRGQVAVSTRFMASVFMWSEARVRRYLDFLENRRMIQRGTDAGITVVTVCKYDEYQNGGEASDAPATRQSTRDRRTSDAKKKKDEIREEGLKDANASLSSPVPSSYLSRFQEFWDAYPHRGGNKKGRADCEKVYARAVKAGVSQQNIIEAAARAREDPDVKRGYGRAALPWLNQRGWEDEIQPQPNLTIIPGSAYDRQSPQQNRQAAAADAQRRIYDAAVRNRAPSGADIGFG